MHPTGFENLSSIIDEVSLCWKSRMCYKDAVTAKAAFLFAVSLLFPGPAERGGRRQFQEAAVFLSDPSAKFDG